MPANFPTSLDSNPSAATLAAGNLDTDPHSVLHANLGDQIEALEAKVGVDGSAVTTSHDYKLAQLALVDALVGTATGALSGEIVVGTSPGGELGGTWASPTVDATHSGSSHAGVQAAAEATAAAALSTHEADTTSVHGIADTSILVTTTGTQTLTNKSIVATQLTGTLQAGQFPALTGDVTTSAGAVATTLANSGVTAASYGSSSAIPVITFDAKGRATTATTAAIASDPATLIVARAFFK